MKFKIFFVITVTSVISFVGSSKSSVKVREKLSFKLDTLKERNVLPWNILAFEGENVYMQLAKLPKEVIDCQVVLPDSEKSFTLSNLFQDDRISYWNSEGEGGKCGVKIKNVTTEDQGRYRLKALGADNELVQGVATLSITNMQNIPDRVQLIEDSKDVTVSLLGTNYANYCETNIPPGDKRLKENCDVNFRTVTRTYAGDWKIKAGVAGKIEEIQIHTKAEVFGRNFDVGTKQVNNSKTELHCSLNDVSNVQITFCRFLRGADNAGFNLNDGVGNDRYRYYGKGLKYGECGILIEKPNSADEGLWKCSVGLNDTKSNAFELFESYVTVSHKLLRSTRSVANANAVAKNAQVTAQVGNVLKIDCVANVRLKYCWFKHPNGTVFDPVPQDQRSTDSPDADWFSSDKHLLIGQCGMKIKQADYSDKGIWTCNMGQLDAIGMDLVSEINVKISNSSLVAVDERISGEIADSLTIRCISVIPEKHLQYCRFTAPDGSGFNVQEDITERKAIENQYFYNGTGLLNGDCQVTIKSLQKKHIGKWTCTALNNMNVGTDVIIVETTKGEMSLAAVSTIVGFTVIVLVGLGFAIMYVTKKYGRPAANIQNEEQVEGNVINEEIELGDIAERGEN